jgi:hypothetical protein
LACFELAEGLIFWNSGYRPANGYTSSSAAREALETPFCVYKTTLRQLKWQLTGLSVWLGATEQGPWAANPGNSAIPAAFRVHGCAVIVKSLGSLCDEMPWIVENAHRERLDGFTYRISQ